MHYNTIDDTPQNNSLNAKTYFLIAVILLFKSIIVLTVYREGNKKNEKYIHIYLERNARNFFYFVFEWAHWVVKFFWR